MSNSEARKRATEKAAEDERAGDVEALALAVTDFAEPAIGFRLSLAVRDEIARRILASDWLAARDARLIAEAEHRGAERRLDPAYRDVEVCACSTPGWTHHTGFHTFVEAREERARRGERERIAQAIEAEIRRFGQTDAHDPVRAGLIEGYRDAANMTRAGQIGEVRP